MDVSTAVCDNHQRSGRYGFRYCHVLLSLLLYSNVVVRVWGSEFRVFNLQNKF